MKNVLLINPPWVIGEDKNLWKQVASSWPSLGLGYIASVLERDGHQVYYLDCSAEELTVNDTIAKLKIYPRIDFIGFTASTPLINNALAISKAAKEIFPGVKIIAGGTHPSLMPAEVLGYPQIDYVIVDEGEEAMREVVREENPKNILSLCYRDGENIIKNELRPLIKNLDDLPMPAYHLMPMDKYHPAIGGYKKLPVMIMLVTRGCPGRCTFCNRTFRGKVRIRSPKKIIEEIKFLRNNYGIKEMAFYDDTFTMFREVVKELCERMIKEELNMPWSCFSRVDWLDEELLRLMKQSGCHSMLIGVESSNEEILKRINKKISLDQVKKVAHLCRQIGIETRASYMFGNPGETEETIKDTIDFAIELDTDEVIFNITTPYPGTEIYNWAKERGYIKSFNWDDYSYSNVVLELPNLSREKLQYYYNYAHRRFYFRPKVILRRLKNIKSWEQFKQEIKGALALIKFSYR